MRLMDLQSKWLKIHITVQGIKEVISDEQFLNGLQLEKRALVKDKKPTTCIQAGELADEYELARNQNQEPQDQADTPPRKPEAITLGSKEVVWLLPSAGHLKGDCRKLLGKRDKDTSGQELGRRPPLRCFNCKKEGHIAANCPSEPVLLCQATTTAGARPPKIDVW